MNVTDVVLNEKGRLGCFEKIKKIPGTYLGRMSGLDLEHIRRIYLIVLLLKNRHEYVNIT